MKFYGQFDVPVDRFIFERYFPDINIRGTFIECGAFDGEMECSCRFFEETMGWVGFNLEPVPWIFERLQQNRPNSRNLNLGLSNSVATLPFRAVNHPNFGRYTTIGSLKHDSSLEALLAAGGCTFEDISIEVIDWVRLIERETIDHVTLMVLDVEGHELDVLTGMQGSTVLPEVMCVEFGHIGFDKLRRVMEELGYAYDIHSFANAFFIRRDVLPLYAMRQAAAAQSRMERERQTRVEEELRDQLADTKKYLDNLSLSFANKEKENMLIITEIEWLRGRERELMRELNTILNSRGWKALEKAKSIYFYRKRRDG